MKALEITRKDLIQALRSSFGLGMMFGAPLLVAGLIYLAFGGASDKPEMPLTKVAVVNQDIPAPGAPAFGEILVSMLSDSSVSDWLSVQSAPDEESARALLKRQEVGVVLLISPGFSRSLLEGAEGPSLRMLKDPALTIGPMIVEGMIRSLVDGVEGARIALALQRERREALGLAPLTQAQRAALQESYQGWFIEAQRARFHSGGGALVVRAPSASGEEAVSQTAKILSLVLIGQLIFFSFYTGAYSMISILREDEEGTLQRLFTTPTPRTTILLGKLLAVFLMVVVQALVMLTAGRVVFGVQWGSPLWVAPALLAQVVAATGLGVFLISLVKTPRQAGPVLGGALTALAMLGGLFTVGVPSMPGAFRLIALFTPQGWALEAWRACLEGRVSWWALGLSLVGGVVMFLVGAWRFARRFA